MGTHRLEAFSDAVIAIAITLLVLDLKVPEDPEGGLAHALVIQWPAYAAYVTSFVTIGIMWVNHHVIVASIHHVDRVTLFLNLLLLFGIGTLPFTTSLAASYLLEESGSRLALVVYAGWMALVAAAFVLLLLHLGRHPDMLKAEITPAENQAAVRRGMAGVGAYVAAAAVALVSPVACLAVCLAMPLYYILAGRRLGAGLFTGTA